MRLRPCPKPPSRGKHVPVQSHHCTVRFHLPCQTGFNLPGSARKPEPEPCPNAQTSNPSSIIGAGPIVIGQACEFDYSGTQACKALKEEGYRVILVNSNPATIMTDPEFADATYIEPITPEMVAKIIEKEKPDALLPTMGGQTA